MEIKIRCAHTRMVPVSELKKMLNPQNQNEHPKEQIIELAEQYKFQGVRHPVILSKQTGISIAGECRILTAEYLGMDAMPVDDQEFDSEGQEYAFGVGDNAIALWAKLNLSKIHEQLPNIEPFPIERLAIQKFEFEPAEEQQQPSDPAALQSMFEVVITCASEGDQRDTFERLTKEGYQCRVLSM